jgi:osmotically-inducible protein OsmY
MHSLKIYCMKAYGLKVAGIAMLLGCINAGVMAAEDMPDDEALVQRISRAFTRSDDYRDALVQVHSERGFILLTGQVLTEAARSQATNTVVFASQDIRRIINELVVVDAVDATTAESDASMATAIVAELQAADAAVADKVQVVVHRSVVYLLGALTADEQAVVGDKVSRHPGVASIRTGFEFVSE